MTKTTKSLDQVFDVLDVQDKNDTSNAISTQIVVPEEQSLDSDAETVRDTLYTLLKAGTEAFDDLKRIANSEESPRSFEVLNGMLGNLSDIAMKLIEAQDKVSKIKRAERQGGDKASSVNNGVVNNNTVFVGTTAELQDMLNKNMNIDMEQDDE